MSSWIRHHRVGCVALTGWCVLAAAGSTAWAQTVTGTIFGGVVDAAGLALPGVGITMSSPQLIGGAQTRVSDERGEYRFPALPPGTYRVEFVLAGFQTTHREQIGLEAGASLAVDVTLRVATVEENVTVVADSPMVDVRSSQLRETASAAIIENIPTGRAFTDVFNLMPGVLSGEYNDATTGTNVVHGGSVRNNVFSIDGANANDPLVPYPTTDLNLEMIEEVQITTGGMSAEFGSASGAVFNVITKSGSNRLSGQMSGYLRHRSLQSENLNDALRAQGVLFGQKIDHAADMGASIGGPIRLNRLWYFADYHRLDESRSVINIPTAVTADQNTYFAKATTQVSKRDRVDAFYQYRLRNDFPFQPTVTQLDPKVMRLHRQRNHTVNAKWTSTLTDSTFFETRLSIADQQRFTSFPNASDTDYGYMDRNTGRTWGGWYRELARPGNRNSRQVKADITHYKSNFWVGSHELKAGGSYDWLINSEFRDWQAGARLHVLFNGNADRIQLSNGPVDQKGNVYQLGLYAQDQWSVNKRLTLHLGVRFESVEGWFPEGSVGGVNFERQSFAAQRDVVTFDYASPRLGFAFDPRGDRKTVFKASYGRYYNQVYTGEFSGARPYAFGSQVWTWIDRNTDLVWQPGEQGVLLSDSRVPDLGRIDPDLRPSYVDSWIVGLERELGRSISVSARYIVKKEYDLAETLNAAAPFDEAYNQVAVTNPLGGDPIVIYPLKLAYRGIPTVRYYTNPGPWTCSFCPELDRKYQGLELTFRRRLRGKWQLFGSYVYARSEGNKGTGHSESQGNVFSNPNNLIRYGGLTYDKPHQIKLFGTYQLPYGVLLGASYTGLSGSGWARTVRFLTADVPLIVVEGSITVPGEEVGAQRFDMTHELSVRAEKRLTIGRRSIGIMVDVFNLLNANTVTSVQNSRIDHPDFNKPASILLPRTLRFGMRFGF